MKDNGGVNGALSGALNGALNLSPTQQKVYCEIAGKKGITRDGAGEGLAAVRGYQSGAEGGGGWDEMKSV